MCHSDLVISSVFVAMPSRHGYPTIINGKGCPNFYPQTSVFSNKTGCSLSTYKIPTYVTDKRGKELKTYLTSNFIMSLPEAMQNPGSLKNKFGNHFRAVPIQMAVSFLEETKLCSLPKWVLPSYLKQSTGKTLQRGMCWLVIRMRTTDGENVLFLRTWPV